MNRFSSFFFLSCFNVRTSWISQLVLFNLDGNHYWDLLTKALAKGSLPVVVELPSLGTHEYFCYRADGNIEDMRDGTSLCVFAFPVALALAFAFAFAFASASTISPSYQGIGSHP
jgi:hypothetical protein